MRKLILLAAGLGALAAPAAALDATLDAGVARVVAERIQPAFRMLDVEAAGAAEAIGALCAAPGMDALNAARTAFGETVDAFAAASVFDFGPARAGDRFARLLFWPDRGGRGLRQVQGLIAQGGADLTVAALRAKRVDVQGLPALEFALFGTGADALATAGGAGRCAFAAAAAGAIAETASALNAAWASDGAFVAAFTAPYPADGVYRDAKEATQALLRVAGQTLEGIGRLHLAPALGADPDAAKPKRAVFWRSGLTFAFLDAQIVAAAGVFGEDGLGPALAAGEGASARSSFDFEIKQARRALSAAPSDVLAAFADPEIYGRLAYAQSPAAGAAGVINPRIAGALGLIVGFNSLDGD